MGSSLYDIKRKNHYVTKGLSVFFATCLVVSLAPTVAFGSTTVGVKVEAPVQISKTEQIIPVEEEAPVSQTEPVDPSTQVSDGAAITPASEQPTPAQTTADIPLT
ncbi:MAG: hypothetical protein RR547_02540, partial [Raoultibacter sp.]